LSLSAPIYPRREGGRRRRATPIKRTPASSTAAGRDTATRDFHAWGTYEEFQMKIQLLQNIIGAKRFIVEQIGGKESRNTVSLYIQEIL
jgi:hypothetical protein